DRAHAALRHRSRGAADADRDRQAARVLRRAGLPAGAARTEEAGRVARAGRSARGRITQPWGGQQRPLCARPHKLSRVALAPGWLIQLHRLRGARAEAREVGAALLRKGRQPLTRLLGAGKLAQAAERERPLRGEMLAVEVE